MSANELTEMETRSSSDSGSVNGDNVTRKPKSTKSCNMTNCKYQVVADCLQETGFKITTDRTMCNLFWIDKGVSTERILDMYNEYNAGKSTKRLIIFPECTKSAEKTTWPAMSIAYHAYFQKRSDSFLKHGFFPSKRASSCYITRQKGILHL